MGKILIEARYRGLFSYFHELAKPERSGTIGSVEVSSARLLKTRKLLLLFQGTLVMVQPHAATELNMIPPRTDVALTAGKVNLLDVSTVAAGGDNRQLLAGNSGQTPRDIQVASARPEYLDLSSHAGVSGADASNSLKRVLNDANGMSAGQKAEFQNSIEQFLTQAKKQGLSPDEITRTLDATSRLLEGKGEQPLNEQNRIWLAESLIHNVANPNRCDQGFHNTCNVTAISKVLMAKDPAKMAEIVSAAALDGCYHASDGVTVKLDANSMQPDTEAIGGQTVDNKRNYASQLFDLVAVNNDWQRQHPPMHYVEGRPTGQGDTGERLLTASGRVATDNQGNELHSPFLNCGAMRTIGKELGIKNQFLIANASAAEASGILVRSDADLGEKLQALKGEGGLPAVIFVHSGNKLFTGSYGEGGSGGWHVITVDAYDEKAGTVHISNQWGAANDRTVSLHTLYDATLPPNKWEKGSGIFDRQQYETYHNYMFSGGGGLDKNQVVPNTEFAIWLTKQRKSAEIQQQMQHELTQLQAKLDAALGSHNQAKIDKIMRQIHQVQEGLSRQ
jgi:hypothetical protein